MCGTFAFFNSDRKLSFLLLKLNIHVLKTAQLKPIRLKTEQGRADISGWTGSIY